MKVLPFSEAPYEGVQSWFHFPPAVRVVDIRKRKKKANSFFPFMETKKLKSAFSWLEVPSFSPSHSVKFLFHDHKSAPCWMTCPRGNYCPVPRADTAQFGLSAGLQLHSQSLILGSQLLRRDRILPRASPDTEDCCLWHTPSLRVSPQSYHGYTSNRCTPPPHIRRIPDSVSWAWAPTRVPAVLLSAVVQSMPLLILLRNVLPQRTVCLRVSPLCSKPKGLLLGGKP